MDEVSKTALGVARVRAVESERRTGCSTIRGRRSSVRRRRIRCRAASERRWPGVRVPRDHRTRFYDDHLLESGCRQVVLLAAGLDSRAFRLDWPARTSLYELDLPKVLAFKETCSPTPNPGAHERLCRWTSARMGVSPAGHGFRPQEPTAWLAEGLLVYLTPADADRLLSTVTALSAPGSRIAFERSDCRAATRR